ncbi:hypothetical protein MCOR02_005060 [Pyricularia oryzae]|nr:hypothetical protein MCOR02_005060 [Pyricularia oryzae]
MEFLAILAVLALPALTPHGHGDSPAGRALHCSPNALLRKLFPAALHPGADPNNLDSARSLCQGRQRNRPHRPTSQTRRLHLAALQERGDHRRRRTASSSPTPTYSVLGDGAAAAQPPRRRVVVVLGIPWLGPRVVATARHLRHPGSQLQVLARVSGPRPAAEPATSSPSLTWRAERGLGASAAWPASSGYFGAAPWDGSVARQRIFRTNPTGQQPSVQGTFSAWNECSCANGELVYFDADAVPGQSGSSIYRQVPPPTPGGQFIQYGVLAGGSAILNVGAQVEAFVNAVAAARRDFA